MSSEYIALPGDRILVTGSNGFIGSKVVEKLLEYGFANLRCFVRPSSYLGRLQNVLGKFDGGRSSLVCLLPHCYGLPTNSPRDCAAVCRGCEVRREQGIRV